MTIEDIVSQVEQKYDGVWIEEQIYETLEYLRQDLIATTPDVFICGEPWSEFGVKLVEIGDNNMWTSIVIIKN